MIIKKIQIEGFGKFTDAEYEFKEGLNLIYGNNEDGKTTLMSFVKMMLYSSSAKTEKSADLFKALRKKYRPWNGSTMSGAMEFEQGGMTYRLQKEFLKSDATDKTSIFCITTGENIQIENKNEPGEYFLGMSLDEFERSVFMGQSGGFTADNAANSLAMRISNLSVSGDENISHQQILKRLSTASEELISKSGKKGLLVDAENQLEQLKAEKEQLVLLDDTQKDIEREVAQITAEINGLESDLNVLSDLERTENAKKDLNAFYTLQNKLNLLKALKGQLNSYDASYEDMGKYAAQARELNAKIEHNLSIIQEATLRKGTDIPDEEYARLQELNEKCTQLRKDLELVSGRITVLWAELEKQSKTALKGAKISAFLPLAVGVILAVIAFFALPYGALNVLLGLGSVILGTALFVALFFTAGKRAPSKLAVQLSKRDYQGAVRGLSAFEEDFVQKSPSELEAILNSQLSDISTALSNKLRVYGVENIEQLKAKSDKQAKEDIKAVTDELAIQKEEFVALSCTIKPCANFSAAKILYVELCESLANLKSINQEIKTISLATGIDNTDETFVADKIKTLGEFIQNTPILSNDGNSSIPQIRSALNEKRVKLNQLQSQIKRPDRGMSELLEEIELTRGRVNELKQRYEEINIAIDVINEAVSDTNKGLGSQLSQNVSKYLSKITDGKYSDVLVPKDLSLETRTQGNQTFHEWKYLSTGAIDKVYLSLRLAMTDILAKSHGALPLFLDDMFAQYDDDSIKTALEFLKEYIESNSLVSQIMFFTCHKHILEMAKNIFADYNEITL